MVYIIVDLEMNSIAKIYKQERKICNMETIEIGAVALDAKYSTIGEFKTFIKPQFNTEIYQKYTDLTGITTTMVSASPYFIEAYDNFVEWCKSFNDEYEIYAWSDNDYKQIEAEMQLKGYDEHKRKETLNKWFDFQKEFTENLGLERIMSLEMALDYTAIEFRGKKHDALCDAKNTAELFSIVRDKEKCNKALQSVKDALKPTEFTSALGDMIDFNSLLQQVSNQ